MAMTFHRFLNSLILLAAALSLILLLQGCGETDAGPSECSTPCCQTKPIGGCNLVSAMHGYCCEPLTGEGDVVVDGPKYTKDPRYDPKIPIGKVFSLQMPWAQSIFAKTYNDTFSNPGYLEGQAKKKGLPDSSAYYASAMKWNRSVTVYFPSGFHMPDAGAKVQFVMDGESFCSGLAQMFFWGTGLDNAIAAKQLPPFILICVASANQIRKDGADRVRDFEYETMSDRNAKFLVEEVLPVVEQNAQIQKHHPGLKFSTDRKDRAVMGCSSSGAASIIASWFAPQYFYRALGFSATLVQVLSTPCSRDMDSFQCESATPATLKEGYPRGAWDFHSSQDLIGTSPNKDLRIYHQAAEFDVVGCSTYEEAGAIKNCTEEFSHSGNEGYFNIRLANNRTAAKLVGKGYQTRFVYSLDQYHCSVMTDPLHGGSTILDALVWAWQDDSTQDVVV